MCLQSGIQVGPYWQTLHRYLSTGWVSWYSTHCHMNAMWLCHTSISHSSVLSMSEICFTCLFEFQTRMNASSSLAKGVDVSTPKGVSSVSVFQDWLWVLMEGLVLVSYLLFLESWITKRRKLTCKNPGVMWYLIFQIRKRTFAQLNTEMVCVRDLQQFLFQGRHAVVSLWEEVWGGAVPVDSVPYLEHQSMTCFVRMGLEWPIQATMVGKLIKHR